MASLLAVFAGVNVVTLAILNKQATSNLDTIQSKTTQVEQIATDDLPSAGDSIDLPILGKPPRDYDDDKQELTFLDKLTILFHSLFG